MSHPYAQFAVFLQHTPWLRPYWDLERGELYLPRLRRAMRGWSHGEQVMARFMVGVWRGENVLRFDLIEAMGVLDAGNRALIASWAGRPFWP